MSFISINYSYNVGVIPVGSLSWPWKKKMSNEYERTKDGLFYKLVSSIDIGIKASLQNYIQLFASCNV